MESFVNHPEKVSFEIATEMVTKKKKKKKKKRSFQFRAKAWIILYLADLQ